MESLCLNNNLSRQLVHKLKNFIKILCVSLILAPQLVHAQHNSQVFIDTGNIPKGFEFLAAPQQNIVDVFFAGEYVKSSLATFTLKYLSFHNPETVVNALPGVTNRAKVLAALKTKLATHSDLIGHNFYPEEAGIVFDQNKHRVDIFINSRYLKSPTSTDILLPPSSAGLSSLHHLYAVAAGTTGQIASNAFSISDTPTLAYHEAMVSGQFSCSHSYNGGPNGYDFANNCQINDLAAQVYKQNYKMAAGYIKTSGNFLINQSNFLGVSVQTTLDTLVNANQAYGNKIIVFLSTPSQVSIFSNSNGRLLSSKFYPAGNQVLDTADLPDGSYNIDLRITGSNGVVTKQTKYFSKTMQVPPADYPIYYANLGYLESHFSSDQNKALFPEISNRPIAQLGMLKRINDSLGVFGQLVYNNTDSLANLGITFFKPHFLIQPQAFISSTQDIGAAIFAQFATEKFNANIYGRQIWIKNPSSTITMRNDDNWLYPNARDSTSGSLSLTYQLNPALISFNANVNRGDHSGTSYAYGPGLTINFMRAGAFCSLNFNLTKTEKNLVGMGGLTVTMSQPNWYENMQLGQTAVRDDSSHKIDYSGLVANLLVQRNWYDEAQNGLLLEGQAGSNAGSRSLGGRVDYTNGLGKMDVQVINYSGSHTQDNTQFTASYDDSFVLAGNKLSGSNSNGYNSGVLVSIVSSDKTNDKFQVIADGNIAKIVGVNSPTPVFLNPMHTYNITIKPEKKTFYHFDQSPKIVTLYPGNIMALTWKAERKIIIFTRVLDQNRQPIVNAPVKDGIDLFATDNEGYLQMELLADTKKLVINPNQNKSCEITLPPLTGIKGFVQLNDLICGVPASFANNSMK